MVDDNEAAEVMNRFEKDMDITKEKWLKSTQEEKISLFGKFTNKTVGHNQQTILIPKMTKSLTKPKIKIPTISLVFTIKGVFIDIDKVKLNVSGRYYNTKNGRFVKKHENKE